jgi:hypothetical protein
MKKTAYALIAALLIIGIGAAALLWWQGQKPPAEPAVTAVPAAQPEPTAQAAPAIKYPIEAISPKQDTAIDDSARAENVDERVRTALIDLLGADAVNSFLRTTDFPRRVVATVDNLARAQAAPSLWPINPTPGRVSIEQRDGSAVLSDANASRYTPFVQLVESVDTDRAIALYVRLYPLFQSAYENLGYPGRYFNDRLIAVIDNLLATPDLAGPFELTNTKISSAGQPARPSLQYRFADPALEAATAGQKMLLRVGPDNRRRLKAKLRDIRQRLSNQAVGSPE